MLMRAYGIIFSFHSSIAFESIPSLRMHPQSTRWSQFSVLYCVDRTRFGSVDYLSVQITKWRRRNRNREEMKIKKKTRHITYIDLGKNKKKKTDQKFKNAWNGLDASIWYSLLFAFLVTHTFVRPNWLRAVIIKRNSNSIRCTISTVGTGR